MDTDMNKTMDGRSYDEALKLQMQNRLMYAQDADSPLKGDTAKKIKRRLKDHAEWIRVDWDIEDHFNEDGSPFEKSSELIFYREVTFAEIREDASHCLKELMDYSMLQKECEDLIYSLLEKDSKDLELHLKRVVTKTYRPGCDVPEAMVNKRVKQIMKRVNK
jgi:hypothetical protein